MNTLDDKIKSIFPSESVFKIPERYGVFIGKNLPSFIKDWLVKKFTDSDGELDTQGLITFMNDHIPQKDSKLKGTLISDLVQVKILCRLITEPDIKTGLVKFSIPDLGIKTNEGRVPPSIVRKHPELKGGESWGVVTLAYTPPHDGERGVIEIVDYKPFKPYDVDINYYRTARNDFSLEEWVDLIIRSMEYNPQGFNSLTEKILFISRLLTFIEPKLNIIELAPKGTGKSYVFGNLTKYGWLISGGSVSRAKLFYDISKSMPGIITMYDYVAMDEVETIRFTDEFEPRGALKNYLEFGVFTVANVKQTSLSGLMLLGNIPLDKNNNPIDSNYFSILPKFFHDSALLDRFHGFIEGWKLPRIKENLKVRGYTLNVEYFAEILHSLRSLADFASTVNDLIEVPKDADTRDTVAIKRLCTGYMKLLFPNVVNAGDIDKDDFKNFCLNPALEKRGIVRKQIHRMDIEFAEDIPNICVKK